VSDFLIIILTRLTSYIALAVTTTSMANARSTLCQNGLPHAWNSVQNTTDLIYLNC